jgi:hypothetical protein
MSLCLVSHFIYCYVECRYAECHYAECHYAECHGAQHGGWTLNSQVYDSGFEPQHWTETEKMTKKGFITSLPLVLIMQGLEFYIKSH